MRGFLPLISNNSATHIHGLSVFLTEGFLFARDVSLKNPVDCWLCFRLAVLHSVSYFLLVYRSPSSSLCTGVDAVPSNIDEVLSMNLSTNVFVFGEFNVRHKDWLTFLGGTDRPDVIIFLSQKTLLRWLTFLLGSLAMTLTILLFWTYLVLLALVFVQQWLSLHWEILIMLLSQLLLTFRQTQNGMPRFIT